MLQTLMGAFGFHTRTFSIEETADILSVSTDQIKIWLQDGTLPYKKILGMSRIEHNTVWKVVKVSMVGAIAGVYGETNELIEASKHYM